MYMFTYVYIYDYIECSCHLLLTITDCTHCLRPISDANNDYDRRLHTKITTTACTNDYDSNNNIANDITANEEYN